ncbi:MAG: hypothetical protein HY319_25475 [Armatimonadetes bacterium]|nr:hypothetical protein [Armatimonadota bacterium]
MATAATPGPTPPQQPVSYGRAVLERRNRTIADVGSGKLNRAEFQSLSEHSLRTDYLRSAAGGANLGDADRQMLSDRLRQYDALYQKFVAGDENPEFKPADSIARYQYDTAGAVYDALTTGKADADLGRQAMANMGLQSYTFGMPTRQGSWEPGDRSLYRQQTDPLYAPQGRAAAQPTTTVPATPRAELVDSVGRNFDRWDLDRNGRLVTGELDRAMADPAVKGADAAALATLRRDGELLSRLRPGEAGVARDDVAAYAQGGEGVDPELRQQALRDVGNHYATAAERQKALQAGTPLFAEGGPRRDAVRQGLAGSCNFLSSLASRNPEQLREMIQPQADGTYRVRFPGGAEAIVKEPTEAQQLYHASAGANGKWAAIAEMGFGQVLAGQGEGGGNARSALDGVRMGRAIEGVTGRPAVLVDFASPGAASFHQTRQALIEATQGSDLVVAGTTKEEPGPHTPGVLTDHTYTVLGFDPKTNTVSLRNPWGQGEPYGGKDGTDDGVFQMPYDQFYANFGLLGYAKPR